jgi:hypothetical protein
MAGAAVARLAAWQSRIQPSVGSSRVQHGPACSLQGNLHGSCLRNKLGNGLWSAPGQQSQWNLQCCSWQLRPSADWLRWRVPGVFV